MKKLLSLPLYLTTLTIMGMEEIDKINQLRDQLNHKIKITALSCFINNVHQHRLPKNHNNPTQPTKAFLKDMGQLNKDLYTAIRGIKKSPVFISNIIRSLAIQNNSEESNVASDLTYLNKCDSDKTVPHYYISLTNQLYDESLTKNKVKELYHQGALINYLKGYKPTRDFPLIHWIKQCINGNEKASEIVETLLELGAEHTYPHYRAQLDVKKDMILY